VIRRVDLTDVVEETSAPIGRIYVLNQSIPIFNESLPHLCDGYGSLVMRLEDLKWPNAVMSSFDYFTPPKEVEDTLRLSEIKEHFSDIQKLGQEEAFDTFAVEKMLAEFGISSLLLLE